MKKAMMNASVASMIYKFNLQNLDLLKSLGFEVDVSCNFGKENPISAEQVESFRRILKEKGIRAFETDCPRSIFAFSQMKSTFKTLKKLSENGYDLVHTQSPIGGALCRLAFSKSRKSGTKIIYQAHGFHFYKGAPLVNFLVFYPIERFCSRFTDVLITINKEDFAFAQKKMKAKKVVYVPGIGLDTERFKPTEQAKRNGEKIRQDLGIGESEILLLCVGELNENKNHTVVLSALEKLKNEFGGAFPFKLAIAGQGEKSEELLAQAKRAGLENRLHLLGFCDDMPSLYAAADAFVFPSKREGLAVSVMEAMASGLPCVVSKIRGNVDLIDENKGGLLFEPSDTDALSQALRLLESKEQREAFGEYNQKKVELFSAQRVKALMEEIYSFLLTH